MQIDYNIFGRWKYFTIHIAYKISTIHIDYVSTLHIDYSRDGQGRAILGRPARPDGLA